MNLQKKKFEIVIPEIKSVDDTKTDGKKVNEESTANTSKKGDESVKLSPQKQMDSAAVAPNGKSAAAPPVPSFSKINAKEEPPALDSMYNY